MVDEGAGQKVLQLDHAGVSSQVNRQPRGYRDQSDASWYTSQLLKAPAHAGKAPLDLIEEVDDTEDFHESSRNSPRPHKPAQDEEKKFNVEGLLSDDGLIFDEAWADEALGVSPLKAEDSPYNANSDTSEDETLAKTAPSTPDKATTHDDLPPLTSLKNRELTAEEHNTILLADPRMRKSTVVNPDFLEQYYRESRLHHLSTWKADLKAQLQAQTASSSQGPRPKRSPGARRYIMHVDFDSFFVAVSLKKCPESMNKPAVVAHGSGSGSEIASCNYPAREFGIRNGMWMKKAQELCNDIKVLPYDFPGYETASRIFYEAILATGGVVQSVSVDEALIDVTSLCLPAGGTDGVEVREGSIWREQSKAEQLGRDLREKVKERTGCAVSVGIGGNILLAKLALRKAKPAGQHQVKPEEILDFIADLEVQSLPGVARSIGGRLEEIGIKYVKDIRQATKERLVSVLGPKTGEKLWLYSRGIDKTEVGDQVVRKSVSAEVNWGVRFETQEQVEEFVDSLCGELGRRLVKERVRGKQLTMKIMRRSADAPLDPPKQLGHGKCDTFNKSSVFGVATNVQSVLSKEAISIIRGFGFSPGELRGLGIQMTKLEPLKPAMGGDTDGSQRRLQFKMNPASKSAQEDPIKDDVVTPRKIKPSQFTIYPPAALLARPESPSRKLLNTLGTQFILPTQVDPEILAQLPDDIRSRLFKNVRQSVEAVKPDNDHATKTSFSSFPTQSQIDPEVFKSLPSDLRAEVLAEFEKSPSRQRGGQSLLPQSPRKNRTLPPSRKPPPPTRRKRGGAGNLLSRFKAVAARSDTPTLTQSNFLTTTRAGSHEPIASDSEADPDAEFLAALPEDIRREVLENARRAQLKRTAGLEVTRKRGLQPRPKPSAQQLEQQLQQNGERTIELPPRPARPTFTMHKLSALPELRDALSAWVGEFGREGPYAEDVEALGRYLRAVVGEEGDMAKAVGVVKWMEWLVVEKAEEGMSGKWARALERTREVVRDAVGRRGLGSVEL